MTMPEATNLRKTAVLVFALAWAWTVTVPAAAQNAAPPASGPVLLTVTGKIAKPGPGGQTTFDRAQLDKLPQTTVTTETPWTTGTQTFSGPSINDVMASVGAEGTLLKASALNNYVVVMPRDAAEDNGAIIATLHNGKPMSVRGKGPLWVIFPWSKSEKIRNEKFYAYGVWQLLKIDVQ